MQFTVNGKYSVVCLFVIYTCYLLSLIYISQFTKKCRIAVEKFHLSKNVFPEIPGFIARPKVIFGLII